MTTRTITVKQVDQLLSHLPSITEASASGGATWENTGWQPDERGVMSLPYPDYSAGVQQFFDCAAQSCWNDSRYDPTAAEAMLRDDGRLASATFDEIRAMLTYCVRGERFNTGHWSQLLRSGRLLALLGRLAELRQSLSSNKAGIVKLEPQVVGNVGLYYCAYKLSRLGWNVMPTSRNAKGVDIIAYNQDASRFVGVQVKALAARSPVPLKESLDKIMGDFWVIINKAISGEPSAYILLPGEVKERAHRGEKEGRVSYWLQPKAYEDEAFKDAWHRIVPKDNQ